MVVLSYDYVYYKLFVGNEYKVCQINTGLFFKTEYTTSGEGRKSSDGKFWTKTTRC